MTKGSPKVGTRLDRYEEKATYCTQTDREQEAETDTAVHASLEAEDDGDRHNKDPKVGGKVNAVGGIGEGDFVDTGARGGGSGIPPALDWPAPQAEGDLDGNEPAEHDGRRDRDGRAEPHRREDPPIQSQDRELRARDRHVIEVAEDVVALSAVAGGKKNIKSVVEAG